LDGSLRSSYKIGAAFLLTRRSTVRQERHPEGEGGAECHDSTFFTFLPNQKGRLLAFYNGLLVPCEIDFYPLMYGPPPRGDHEWERNAYLLAIGKTAKDEEFCVDLPPEMGRNRKLYKATLGHKCNHSFEVRELLPSL